MGLSTKIIVALEDKALCKAVLDALARDYNKELIKRRFQISRRQLERIIETKEKSK